MSQVVERDVASETLLFVYKDHPALMDALFKMVKAYDMHIRVAETIPDTFHGITYMLIAQNEFTQDELSAIFSSRTKVLLITSHEKTFDSCRELISKNTSDHVRVVYVSFDETHQDAVERILWFMLSRTSEISLHMGSTIETQPIKKNVRPPHRFNKNRFTRKRLIISACSFILLLHTFFLIPLAVTTAFMYQAGNSLKDQKVEQTHVQINRAKIAFRLTQGAYALAHPGLQFLFLSVLPDNIMSIEQNALTFIDTSVETSANAHRIASLVLNTHKDIGEIQEARQRILTLQQQVATLEKTSQNVQDRLTYTIGPLEKVREDFQKIASYLSTGSQLIGHMDSLLADNTEKDYIFFFYNNMEIRPGGGFIGSFAHVVFADYTLKSFDIYDVYDADGQLKTHVRPPAAIRDHLDQPHWFLRDSNFSPDFEKNVETAQFFLDRELGIKDIDGAVGMTTTALTYLLKAFGDVYIPDFDETINSENFYITTQTQTEADYFPGSQQKKSFLSTVGRHLMLKMEDANPALLGLAIKQALDEKHLVIYMKDSVVQADINNLGWSGKILNPQCLNPQGCIINHVLPVDANLGVNKANYFVSKLLKLKTVFEEDASIKNELSISYTNTAAPGVSPGGTYKNYVQLYVPSTASIAGLEINGNPIEHYDISHTGLFKIVGTLIQIRPKETVMITLLYNLKERVKQGENTYQIVLQKQIGSFNSDFSLEIAYPEDVLITDLNFKSVAKNHSVLYNSSLSTNKIFVIDFVKE